MLLLALLSIVLAIVHRCGRLKKVRHIYLVGTVTIVTLALTISAAGSIKYRSEHFPLTQPGTTWSTEDGTIALEVYESKSGLSDWYEYDMRMLVDGEYIAVEFRTAGHWDGELYIGAASSGTESNTSPPVRGAWPAAIRWCCATATGE